MPRNVYKFPEEQGIKNRKNIEDYKNFVKEYVLTRMGSGQFVNCKIYGNIADGEVYTTWLYDNLPNKKELILADVIKEIAPTKQGYPCCVVSRELEQRETIKKGLKDYEIKYEFKMVMYSKRPELDTLLNQGWQIRKWFESLEIFTVADLEMERDTPTW